MMVARDVEEQACEAESEELVTNGQDQPLSVSHDSVVFTNAAEEIPEYRKQLLLAKDEMANVADMYQQDYLDKVEQRADLANEARLKAVSCLVDVSKKIYNLAGCFQQLLEDQADKLQEIENMTVTASASFEITSCYNLRNELHSRVPPANVTNRQPRIGRPDAMETNEFFKENVIWEKLNYSKYDRLGAGLNEFDDFQESVYIDNTVPKSTSQQSLHSTGSSNKSYVTASSAISPVPPNSNHTTFNSQDPRLSASSIDIRQPKSPALNRYGSTTSLTSLNSSKSDHMKGISGTLQTKPVATVKRTLSSMKLQPARAAPAPPPAKQNPHRNRVYSVKNETGEGLEKPSIPPPQPPPEEDHYAIPPSQHRLPALSEERGTPTPTSGEVIYDDVRNKGRDPAAAPPHPQYQTITVVPPVPPPPPDNGYVDDDELYMDMDEITASASTSTPASPTTPSPATPTTPNCDVYLSPSTGLFGGPLSPVAARYNVFKKQGNPGPIMVAPPTIPEDSDSEFEDRDSGAADDEEEDDEDDIYQDVDSINIYDAPSLRNSLVRPDSVSSCNTPTNLPFEEDDDLYIDNELLPPPAELSFDDGALPPPPPDILPPPPPPDDDDEELYADMFPDMMPDQDNIYSDNIIDSNDMVNAHTVSVSKDSGFYTMDQEEDDPVIEKVRAIFVYAATASDELNLNPGDIVSVHVKNPDGWYEGTLKGVRGLFPGNYVESLE